MPIFSFFSNDYFPSGLSFDVFSMPPKDVNDSSDAVSAHKTNGGTSILIFISAQALSSVGFAVSIFAIWFGWLLPASVTAPGPAAADASEIKKTQKARLPSRHPRRSEPEPEPNASESKPTPVRRASAPVDLTPILVPYPDDGQNNYRRVYFADSPRTSIIRRNTMPEPKCLPGSQQIAEPVEFTPSPSPSTQLTPECDEEALPDFDSLPPSSKASSRPPSRFQKLKLGFNTKTVRPDVVDKPVDQASIASTDTNTSDKSARRASGGTFVAAWTLSRHRTAPDMNAEMSSPSPSRLSFARRMSPSRPNSVSPGPAITMSAADILSPTFLSRKSQKRASAPIPRTLPYGAPYFATPPLLLDNNYPAYLKTLPQFEDALNVSASHASDGEECRGRTPGIRRVNLNPPHRAVPKRRSASEDCIQRAECKS
ncbi:hypothetical protein M413DRAFT_22186 [Hebeloma cylindrosporum]|uniref:Uncharacterized protein n=1 Tax=Hebeloma cylindrosporum TaxID=76867 RepID=A0A0C3CTV2_HEBCY|nr:hypothetical protein M413DRAFT_22186 [Hebeloma cylindrosporum h7]